MGAPPNRASVKKSFFSNQLNAFSPDSVARIRPNRRGPDRDSRSSPKKGMWGGVRAIGVVPGPSGFNANSGAPARNFQSAQIGQRVGRLQTHGSQMGRVMRSNEESRCRPHFGAARQEGGCGRPVLTRQSGADGVVFTKRGAQRWADQSGGGQKAMGCEYLDGGSGFRPTAV